MKQKAQIILTGYLPISDGGEVAIGRIIGHPRQDSFHGPLQRTSRIVRKWEGGFETLNTIYESVGVTE